MELKASIAKPSDLQEVDASTWPSRAFPTPKGRVGGVIPIVIKRSILNSIHRHGHERTDVEICGVLVGKGYHDDAGPFVYVEGAIRGDHAGSEIAQVTFTAKTWNHIYAILDGAWPTHRIVAWYHTHPGFGIFLSDMDLFIHRNFFAAADQFALVYDPLGGDEGVFIWRRGEPVRMPALVEEDEEVWMPNSKPVDLKSSSVVDAHSQAIEVPPDLRAMLAELARLQRKLRWSVVILALFVFLWPPAFLCLTNRQLENTREETSPAGTAADVAIPKAVPTGEVEGERQAESEKETSP